MRGGTFVLVHGSKRKRTCKATPDDLVHESKESCTGTRRTETCVAPKHVDASHAALLTICSFCYRALDFIFMLFPRTIILYYISVGGKELRCQTFSFLFFLFSTTTSGIDYRVKHLVVCSG